MFWMYELQFYDKRLLKKPGIHGQCRQQKTVFPAALINIICEVSEKRHCNVVHSNVRN